MPGTPITLAWRVTLCTPPPLPHFRKQTADRQHNSRTASVPPVYGVYQLPRLHPSPSTRAANTYTHTRTPHCNTRPPPLRAHSLVTLPRPSHLSTTTHAAQSHSPLSQSLSTTLPRFCVTTVRTHLYSHRTFNQPTPCPIPPTHSTLGKAPSAPPSISVSTLAPPLPLPHPSARRTGALLDIRSIRSLRTPTATGPQALAPRSFPPNPSIIGPRRSKGASLGESHQPVALSFVHHSTRAHAHTPPHLSSITSLSLTHSLSPSPTSSLPDHPLRTLNISLAAPTHHQNAAQSPRNRVSTGGLPSTISTTLPPICQLSLSETHPSGYHLLTHTSNSWHETQAIYSCDFQPLPTSQLKRLLPTSDDDDKTDKASASAVGRQYRLATCGGDFKVRVSNMPAQPHRYGDTDVVLAVDGSPQYPDRLLVGSCRSHRPGDCPSPPSRRVPRDPRKTYRGRQRCPLLAKRPNSGVG